VKSPARAPVRGPSGGRVRGRAGLTGARVLTDTRQPGSATTSAGPSERPSASPARAVSSGLRLTIVVDAITGAFDKIDIQGAGGYVVNGIRTMYARAGRRISIYGHSHGGEVPRWALRFWPDTRRMFADAVGAARPNHGTVVADAAFVGGYLLMLAASARFAHVYRASGFPVGSGRAHAALGGGALDGTAARHRAGKIDVVDPPRADQFFRLLVRQHQIVKKTLGQPRLPKCLGL